MKFKYSVLFLILFLFFNMAAISAKEINNNDFYNLENSINIKSNFKENGLKMQFKTKKSIEKEYVDLKKYLIDKSNGIYTKIDNERFEIFNNGIKICVNLWRIEDYTYTEITIINTNPEYKVKSLEELIGNIKKLDIKELKIFLYYKGEINNNKSINDFHEIESLNNLNILSINNGYTGTGISKLGTKMNFALVSYNDKSQIIIGTPIIFTTY